MLLPITVSSSILCFSQVLKPFSPKTTLLVYIKHGREERKARMLPYEIVYVASGEIQGERYCEAHATGYSKKRDRGLQEVEVQLRANGLQHVAQ